MDCALRFRRYWQSGNHCSGSTGLLKSVRVPTLVMVGQYDYVCSKAARLLAQTIPNASLKIIENSGHMSPLEQPAAFNAALLEFLGEPHRPAA